jgi:hypothetical protein
MKFFATVVAAAAAVSATPVFKVSDFSAGCIPHSTQCLYVFTLNRWGFFCDPNILAFSYEFDVIRPGTMETQPVHCTAMVSANTDGTLPDVKEGPCDESSRTFDVVRTVDGLEFTVSQPSTPATNLTGFHLIPNDQLVISNEPNAVVQSYKGPEDFDLSYE